MSRVCGPDERRDLLRLRSNITVQYQEVLLDGFVTKMLGKYTLSSAISSDCQVHLGRLTCSQCYLTAVINMPLITFLVIRRRIFLRDRRSHGGRLAFDRLGNLCDCQLTQVMVTETRLASGDRALGSRMYSHTIVGCHVLSLSKINIPTCWFLIPAARARQVEIH